MASVLIKTLDACTLTGGKSIPWGRTVAVEEAEAAKLVKNGLAIRVARVVFDVPTGPYNPGEVATFPEKEADLLVTAKKARPYVEA